MKRIFTVCSLLCLLLVTGCAGMPGTNAGALSVASLAQL
jgi:hypothetical protein